MDGRSESLLITFGTIKARNLSNVEAIDIQKKRVIGLE